MDFDKLAQIALLFLLIGPVIVGIILGFATFFRLERERRAVTDKGSTALDVNPPPPVGWEMIRDARIEQINKGFDDSDKRETDLPRAAIACLMLQTCMSDFFKDRKLFADTFWPWPPIPYLVKISRKSRVQQLAIAGAFCAAEIDRILANEKPPAPEPATDQTTN